MSKSYGIETSSLEALDEASAERLFGDTSSLWPKTLNLTPTKVVVRVVPTGGLAAESFALFHDNLIYNHKGEAICSAKELVEILPGIM